MLKRILTMSLTAVLCLGFCVTPSYAAAAPRIAIDRAPAIGGEGRYRRREREDSTEKGDKNAF